MSADQPEDETNDRFEEIFGEPALLEGEDRERYLRLYAAVEVDIEPKSFFDRMLVREQTDKIWEELRYKRCSAALIDSAHVEALASLLSPIYEHKMTLTSAGQAAVKFYSADPKVKKEVTAVMAQYGITEAKVQAKAMQIIGGTLQLFDRMISNRENARRNLRKEQEKRAATKDTRGPADLEKGA
jgi:hypothetical protein